MKKKYIINVLLDAIYSVFKALGYTLVTLGALNLV